MCGMSSKMGGRGNARVVLEVLLQEEEKEEKEGEGEVIFSNM